MTHNRVTELILRECPKCGTLGERGKRECAKCGTSLVQLHWTPEEVATDAQKAKIDEANRALAESYADRTPDIISNVFPGSDHPKKDSLEQYMSQRAFIGDIYLLIALVVVGVAILVTMISEGIRPWIIALAAVVWLAVEAFLLYRVLSYSTKPGEAPAANSGGSYRALIVSVGEKYAQHNRQYRALKTIADIDGGKCVIVYVGYVPDEMCESFYTVGKEITLVGENGNYTAVLESMK